jgi:Integrase core domain
VATWHGLVTYYVLIVMELATRRVQVTGITPYPTATFMQQCARQLTDPFDGFLLGKRYLIHDRDTKFTQAFDRLLSDSGVEPIVLPPRSPNLNAHCERFVRSIKEEALEQMVMLGERSLSYAIQQYLSHYHAERNHQGLVNQLIAPYADLGSHHGQVQRRERLGGLLRYYYRDAALFFNHTGMSSSFLRHAKPEGVKARCGVTNGSEDSSSTTTERPHEFFDPTGEIVTIRRQCLVVSSFEQLGVSSPCVAAMRKSCGQAWVSGM